MFNWKDFKIAPQIELIQNVQIKFIVTDSFTVIRIIAFPHYPLNHRYVILIVIDDQSQRFLFLAYQTVLSTWDYFQQFDSFV